MNTILSTFVDNVSSMNIKYYYKLTKILNNHFLARINYNTELVKYLYKSEKIE